MSDYLLPLACPVCSDNHYELIYKDISHTCNVAQLAVGEQITDKVNVVECKTCGHYYLDQVINPAYIQKYYSVTNSEYYKYPAKQISDTRKKENEWTAKFISSRVVPGSLLEIGCGYGFLLNEFKRRSFDVFGVEPSPQASKFAKEDLKLNVVQGFLSEQTFPGVEFDVVILFDVAEHLYSMSQLMQIIKHYLKPGGFLVFGTGNIESWYAKFAGKHWWYLSSWEHISFFTPSSARYLLTEAGFKHIQISKISHMQSFWNNAGVVLKSVIKKLLNLSINSSYLCNVAFDHMIVISQLSGSDKKIQ